MKKKNMLKIRELSQCSCHKYYHADETIPQTFSF